MRLSYEARLGLYLTAVVVVTLIHHPGILLAILAGALLLSGPGRLQLLQRAMRPALWVLLWISSGYLLMGWLASQPVLDTLTLINLRVLLLALLTAWMVRDVDLDLALARYPLASRWLVIVRGQIRLFQRLAAEYWDAQRSRATIRPTLRQRYLGSAAIGLAALDKGVHNAEVVTQAMRSRGALYE